MRAEAEQEIIETIKWEGKNSATLQEEGEQTVMRWFRFNSLDLMKWNFVFISVVVDVLALSEGRKNLASCKTFSPFSRLDDDNEMWNLCFFRVRDENF